MHVFGVNTKRSKIRLENKNAAGVPRAACCWPPAQLPHSLLLGCLLLAGCFLLAASQQVVAAGVASAAGGWVSADLSTEKI